MLKRLSNSYRQFNTDYSNNIMKKRRPLSLNHKLNIRNENTRISEIFKPQYDTKPVVKKKDKKDNKEIKKNDVENIG